MWHSGKEPACNVEDPRDAGLTEQPHMHTLLLKINSVMSVSGVEQVIQLYIYMYLFFFFLITFPHVLCLVAQSCPTLCNPMDYSLPGSSVYGDSPEKNTGVGCHALLQGIFKTQGSSPGLLRCRQVLYHLSHQGSPRILE